MMTTTYASQDQLDREALYWANDAQRAKLAQAMQMGWKVSKVAHKTIGGNIKDTIVFMTAKSTVMGIDSKGIVHRPKPGQKTVFVDYQ